MSAGTVFGSFLDFLGNTIGNALGFNNTAATNKSNLLQVQATNAANKEIAQNTNAMNQAINESNIKFQQAENEITRAREDNAIRRRAADLVGAGLSKTLAAGSPASANALQAPQATIGMSNGPAMQAARSTAFTPDLRTNFETAMTHAKQLEIADKEADIAMLNAQTAADKAKTEKEHYEATDSETARHNKAIEEQNDKYHFLQDEWKKAELNQSSSFHDDAMKLSSAQLALDKLSYMDKHAQMQVQNEYYAAQTELNKTTTSEMAARLTADMAESAARVGLYLEDTKLSVEQLNQVKANIKQTAVMTSYILAEKNHLNAQTKQTLVNTMSSIWNLMLSHAEKTTTTGNVVSESVAEQNALNRKANRTNILTGAAIGAGAGLLTTAVSAFVGPGARFLLQKMFDDNHRAPMGFH